MSGLAFGIGLSGKQDNAYAMFARQQALQAAREQKQAQEDDKRYQSFLQQVSVLPQDYGIRTEDARQRIASYLQKASEKAKNNKDWYGSQENTNEFINLKNDLAKYRNDNADFKYDEALVTHGKAKWKPDFEEKAIDPSLTDYRNEYRIEENRPYQRGEGIYQPKDAATVVKALKGAVASQQGGVITNAQSVPGAAKVANRNQWKEVEIYDPTMWQQAASNYYKANQKDLQYDYPTEQEFVNAYKNNMFDKGGMKGEYIPPSGWNPFNGSGVIYKNDLYNVTKLENGHLLATPTTDSNIIRLPKLTADNTKAIKDDDGNPMPQELAGREITIKGDVEFNPADKTVRVYVSDVKEIQPVPGGREVPTGLNYEQKYYNIPIDIVRDKLYGAMIDKKRNAIPIDKFMGVKVGDIVSSEKAKETKATKGMTKQQIAQGMKELFK